MLAEAIKSSVEGDERVDQQVLNCSQVGMKSVGDSRLKTACILRNTVKQWQIIEKEHLTRFKHYI